MTGGEAGLIPVPLSEARSCATRNRSAAHPGFRTVFERTTSVKLEYAASVDAVVSAGIDGQDAITDFAAR